MIIVVDWSWVGSEDLVAERREHARKLLGSRLACVSYAQIAYGQPERSGTLSGPRLLADAEELAAPAWRSDTFDSADYAVEFTTKAGRVFTCSWDSPGYHEGIWVREVPAQGSAYAHDADVAVWDVSRAGRWDAFIGAEITDVILHYRPWKGEGYWCSRITVAFRERMVHLLLGDTDAGQRLAPSADNIAVVFSPEPLPAWALDD